MSKNRKRAKMKRSYLKVYSSAMINTGQGPSKEHMQSYYDRVSVKSFQDTIPRTLGLSDNRLEIVKVFDTLKELMQDIQVERNIRMPSHLNDTVRLFFNHDCTRWIFLKVTKYPHALHRSLVYPTSAMAKKLYAVGRVTWVEHQLLPKHVPSPNSSPSLEVT